MTKKYDIIVIGGGIVGLAFTAALAKKFKIAIIEANPPELTWSNTENTARVSALNLASLNFLKNLQVWPQLNPKTWSELAALNVWDSLGGGHIHFNAADLGVDRLGIIIENREIVRGLWKQLQNQVDFYLTTPADLQTHDADSVTIMVEGKKLQAQLIVGADGGRSWLREQLKISCYKRAYQQQAIVTVLKTEKPHKNIAYQSFLSTGPLGILPLHDAHQVATVWSLDDEYANKISVEKDLIFNCEITNALDAKLGVMELITERKKIPLIMQHAKQYSSHRGVLIGDAAHTIHPLAGQGANLGLLDAAALAECLLNANEKNQDIGSWRPLRRYERWRKGDNQCMLFAMRAFREVFAEQNDLWIQLRSFGFNVTDRVKFIKKFFMHYAVGQKKDLPTLVKFDSSEFHRINSSG